MSTGINKVILVGNVGADPEVRNTDNGTRVAHFTLATNVRWTDENGDKKEHTEWHRIVAWKKLADLSGAHLKKGRLIYVEGKLRTHEWQDAADQKRVTTEVVAQRIVFLDSAAADTARTAPAQSSSQIDQDAVPAQVETA